MACPPSEDSDQPGHPPSLMRVFAVRMKKASVLSYPLSAQRRLWSNWADAQADLSLRWAHSHFVGFTMRWLFSGKYSKLQTKNQLLTCVFSKPVMTFILLNERCIRTRRYHFTSFLHSHDKAENIQLKMTASFRGTYNKFIDQIIHPLWNLWMTHTKGNKIVRNCWLKILTGTLLHEVIHFNFRQRPILNRHLSLYKMKSLKDLCIFLVQWPGAWGKQDNESVIRHEKSNIEFMCCWYLDTCFFKVFKVLTLEISDWRWKEYGHYLSSKWTRLGYTQQGLFDYLATECNPLKQKVNKMKNIYMHLIIV